MVESAANFRKNGFGDEESAQLARVAALLQNVADEEISAGTATDFLISQLKGFNIASEDASTNNKEYQFKRREQL